MSSLDQLLAAADQLVPVGAAHRELDREAALGSEALLREVLDDSALAGVGVELLAHFGAELRLCRRPLARRHEGHEVDPGVDPAAAEAAGHRENAQHIGAGEQILLAAAHQAVGLGEIGADSAGEADHDPRLILRRHHLLRHGAEDDDRQAEEQEAAGDHPHRATQRPGQHPRVEPGEAGEGLVDGPAHPAPALPGDVEDLRAARRGESHRLEIGEQHRDAEGDAELQEELADDPFHEDHGDEDGADRERRGEGGEGDLARSFARSGDAIFSRLGVAEDVLEHHDGVVHDDADREAEREQREGVEGEAEEIDHRHRAEE